MNIPFYKKPTNAVATHIWYKSGLYDLEPLTSIESALWNWVEDNKVIQRCEESKENIRIFWTAPNAVGYHWTWTSFVKWMLCSCGDPVADTAKIGPIRPTLKLIHDPIDKNIFSVELD